MTVHVFHGPTISSDEVQRICPGAISHPPVKGSDLFRVDLVAGDVVVIIDGYYYQVPAVRHKEILDVIKRGVSVIGAASLGALRAAELWPFGMVGIGKIYRLFRAGTIEGDDEVAVLHADAEHGYQPVSMALVNLRFQARAAARSGVISRAFEERLVQTAAGLPFQQRTRPSLRQQFTGDTESQTAVDALFNWTDHYPLDAKHGDAVAALKFAARAPQRSADASRPITSVPRHMFLENWRNHAAGDHLEDGAFITDISSLLVYQMHAPDYPAFQEQVALNVIRRSLTDSGGSGDDAAVATRYLQSKGFITGDHLPEGWHQFLYESEADLPLEEKLRRIISRTFEASPQMLNSPPLIQELRTRELLERGRTLMGEVQTYNRELERRQPEFNPSRLLKSRVLDWYAERWQAEDLAVAAMARGIFTLSQLYERGKIFYICDRETDTLRAVSLTPVEASVATPVPSSSA